MILILIIQLENETLLVILVKQMDVVSSQMNKLWKLERDMLTNLCQRFIKIMLINIQNLVFKKF